MNKKILIIASDPNSINSEIIYKSWKKINKKIKKEIILIGNFNLIKEQFKKLKIKIKILKVVNFDDIKSNNDLKIFDVPVTFKNPFAVEEKKASNYLFNCLKLADKLARSKKVKGIINCPIDKKLIKKIQKPGLTEYFASISKVPEKTEVMMIYNKKLSVVPLTTHIKIKNIPKNINKNLIITKLLSLNNNYKKIFKIKPKIGILGLNPHIGEMKNDTEEVKKIIPAILKLKKKGVNITGPLSADTVFIENYKNFNVLVGMYHDQVLTPFKTLFHYNAINITLGLPYVRVSPDHGPAYDLIGKNKGNYLSLLNCVKFIYNLNK
ncbi:MAG: 4-hydroxythreonine-4-phosphate dehydrogenase PdxA [Candidatus Pelagibacter sp.]